MLKKTLTVIPGVAAALLPNVTCPACWPAYAGLFSAVGLGFLMTGPYFFFVVSVLLTISLFSLYHKGGERRGYGPLLLGLLAAGIILAGKASGSANSVLYMGAISLIAASIWNRWPRRRSASSAKGILATCACGSCATKELSTGREMSRKTEVAKLSTSTDKSTTLKFKGEEK